MTLIVGIKCSDGIVIGADGAASLGALGHPTALQQTKKLRFHQGKIIVGVSGTVGIGQRLFGIASGLYDANEFARKKPHEAMKTLRDKFWADCLKGEYEAANVTSGLVGNSVAGTSCLSSALVALPVSRQLTLIEFDHGSAPEMVEDDLPITSIGSGKGIADPFLAFLRRIFWRDSRPTVSDGVFATFWTLDHAIKTATGGISEPKQIAVLNDDGCRELDADDLEEHRDHVIAAEKYLSEFKPGAREAEGGAEPAEPPQPPK